MKVDFNVNIDRDLLEKIIDSLGTMIDYADTGDVPRDDKDFEFYFKDLDEARALYERLNHIFGEAYADRMTEIKENK